MTNKIWNLTNEILVWSSRPYCIHVSVSEHFEPIVNLIHLFFLYTHRDLTRELPGIWSVSFSSRSFRPHPKGSVKESVGLILTKESMRISILLDLSWVHSIQLGPSSHFLVSSVLVMSPHSLPFHCPRSFCLSTCRTGSPSHDYSASWTELPLILSSGTRFGLRTSFR
jgi:hypothetical protein